MNQQFKILVSKNNEPFVPLDVLNYGSDEQIKKYSRAYNKIEKDFNKRVLQTLNFTSIRITTVLQLVDYSFSDIGEICKEVRVTHNKNS